jgi:hypothetical protein
MEVFFVKRILVALAIGALLLFPLVGTVVAEPIGAPQPAAVVAVATPNVCSTLTNISDVGYYPGPASLSGAHFLKLSNNDARPVVLTAPLISLAGQTYIDQAAQSQKLEASACVTGVVDFAQAFPVARNNLVISCEGAAIFPAELALTTLTWNSCIGQITENPFTLTFLLADPADGLSLATVLKLPIQTSSTLTGECFGYGTLAAI